jgi:hypothetical protein
MSLTPEQKLFLSIFRDNSKPQTDINLLSSAINILSRENFMFTCAYSGNLILFNQTFNTDFKVVSADNLRFASIYNIMKIMQKIMDNKEQIESNLKNKNKELYNQVRNKDVIIAEFNCIKDNIEQKDNRIVKLQSKLSNHITSCNNELISKDKIIVKLQSKLSNHITSCNNELISKDKIIAKLQYELNIRINNVNSKDIFYEALKSKDKTIAELQSELKNKDTEIAELKSKDKTIVELQLELKNKDTELAELKSKSDIRTELFKSLLNRDTIIIQLQKDLSDNLYQNVQTEVELWSQIKNM